MDLVQRAKAIVFQPKETWNVIKDEQTSIRELYASYAAILAIIPPIATFVGLSLVGRSYPIMGTWRQPILNGLSHAVLYYVLSLIGIYITAYIADSLAPSFGSKKDLTGAVKAVTYSYTPVWIVSILNIVPGLGVLVFVAGLYSLYLLYLGLPLIMETPPEKRIGYVVLVVVATIVVMFVVSLLAGLFLSAAYMGGMVPRP